VTEGSPGAHCVAETRENRATCETAAGLLDWANAMSPAGPADIEEICFTTFSAGEENPAGGPRASSADRIRGQRRFT